VVPPGFAALARQAAPSLDLLALALAAEFHAVDAAAALAELDALGRELTAALPPGAHDAHVQAAACARVLGDRGGFAGAAPGEEAPADALLDRVLRARRGLPVVLCVVYCEVARRARLPMWGVALPGHYVVGHFGRRPALLVDPAAGGRRLPEPLAPRPARPRTPHEIALRILTDLVAVAVARTDVAAAVRAAELRLALPLTPPRRAVLERELAVLRGRLN